MTVDSGPLLPRVTSQASVLPCCAPKQQLYAPNPSPIFRPILILYSPPAHLILMTTLVRVGTLPCSFTEKVSVYSRSQEKTRLRTSCFNLGLWWKGSKLCCQ